jgi:hypothetical protein
MMQTAGWSPYLGWLGSSVQMGRDSPINGAASVKARPRSAQHDVGQAWPQSAQHNIGQAQPRSARCGIGAARG